jgi:hypothetical protein
MQQAAASLAVLQQQQHIPGIGALRYSAPTTPLTHDTQLNPQLQGQLEAPFPALPADVPAGSMHPLADVIIGSQTSPPQTKHCRTRFARLSCHTC